MAYRLGLAQMWVSGGEPERNRSTAEAHVRTLVAKGAQVILLPEALNLGWTHSSCHQMAESIPSGPTFEGFRSLAEELEVFLCAGIVERGEDGQIYNTAVLLDSAGKLLIKHR